MDYGKFKYQQKKRQHKGHTHHSKNKEIRLRPKIGEHDFLTKANRARKFLEERDKVICSVIFPRPRERPRRRRLQAGRETDGQSGGCRQGGATAGNAGSTDRRNLRPQVAGATDALLKAGSAGYYFGSWRSVAAIARESARRVDLPHRPLRWPATGSTLS